MSELSSKEALLAFEETFNWLPMFLGDGDKVKELVVGLSQNVDIIRKDLYAKDKIEKSLSKLKEWIDECIARCDNEKLYENDIIGDKPIYQYTVRKTQQIIKKHFIDLKNKLIELELIESE